MGMQCRIRVSAVYSHAMSNGGDGGGGALAGVLLLGAIYWMGVALALPVGLGLVANALLVIWTVGVVGASGAFSVTLLVFYAREAVKTRNWPWVLDLFAAPTVSMWVGWKLRNGIRGFWVDTTQSFNGSAVYQFLGGAFLFVFFLASIPLSVWGLGVGRRNGVGGTVQRLLAGYLPMFFAFGSWTALVLNSVDPVAVKPPEVAALQGVCKDKAAEAASKLVAESGKNKTVRSSGKTMRLDSIGVGDPQGWNWRTGKTKVIATVNFAWWKGDQSAPAGYSTQHWTCLVHWDQDRKRWAIDRMIYSAS
jgi:hypothetical protein